VPERKYEKYNALSIKINYTLYLQTPARTRNAMKRNNPVQTPGSPTIGAATSMKTEEISPTSTYP
jgi:hypothetical protein